MIIFALGLYTFTCVCICPAQASLAQEKGERHRVVGSLRDTLSGAKQAGDAEGRMRGELMQCQEVRAGNEVTGFPTFKGCALRTCRAEGHSHISCHALTKDGRSMATVMPASQPGSRACSAAAGTLWWLRWDIPGGGARRAQHFHTVLVWNTVMLPARVLNCASETSPEGGQEDQAHENRMRGECCLVLET